MSQLVQTDINEQLVALLGGYDVTLVELEKFYFANHYYPGIRGQVFELDHSKGALVIQLDVQVLLPKTMIIESFIGMATTLEEALNDALEQFKVNTLPVFLEAFWADTKPSEQAVGTEEWEINGERWQVVIGNYGYRGELPIEAVVNDEIFETIKKEVQSLPLTEDIYAIRTSFLNINANEQVVEVIINNEKVLEFEETMRQLSWKKFDGFYSVRNFLLLMKLKK